MAGGWSYEVEGSVVVWDFRRWYDREPEDVEDVMETFREVTTYPVVTGSVFLLGTGGAIDSESFDRAESYAHLFGENGVQRVAFVSPDIKGLALKNILREDPDVEVKVTDDREEAMAWAGE